MTKVNTVVIAVAISVALSTSVFAQFDYEMFEYDTTASMPPAKSSAFQRNQAEVDNKQILEDSFGAIKPPEDTDIFLETTTATSRTFTETDTVGGTVISTDTGIWPKVEIKDNGNDTITTTYTNADGSYMEEVSLKTPPPGMTVCIISVTYYDASRNETGSHKWTYNSITGKLVEEIQYEVINTPGQGRVKRILSATYYNYATAGNVVELIETETYNYDYSEYISTYTKRDAAGALIVEKTFECDYKGTLVRLITTTYPGQPQELTATDTDTATDTQMGSGTLIGTTIYLYDEMDRIIGYERYDGDGRLIK